MSLVIREPAGRDVPLLLELVQQHAAFERSVACLATHELEAIILARPRPIHFLVAECTDDLVGYAAVTFDWSVWRARRYGHLDCLFVIDAWRGQGVGRYLLAEARKIALAEGVDRLEWQTPAWNEDACRFYRQHGAIELPKTRFAWILNGDLLR